MIRLILVFLFLIKISSTDAQTVVWSEDFSTQANGTTNDAGGKWTSTCIGCTSNGSSFFEVRSNAFEGQNTDQEGIWLSEWIDVSAYSQVNLSVLIEGDDSNDPGDYCIAEYRTGPGAYTTMVNGNNDDMNAIIRTAVAQIDGADSIQIRIRLDVSASNEQYVFDDIFVVSVGSQPGSGSALDFDDAAGATAGDVIELGNFPNLVGGDFSMTAWVNSDNVNEQGQRIFCDDENNVADGFSISLGDPGAGRIRFYIRSVNPVSLDMSNAAYYLTNNTWYHVAAVHDASANRRSIYVNGMLAETGTYTNNPGGSPDGIAAIGGEPASSGETTNRFNGEIDEVSIWTTALTQTEIRDLMCQKLTGSETGLLAYYKFDDNIGYVVRDETGNYPGAMTNMDPATDWNTSAAPIGDNSAYLYTGSWAGQSIFLSSVEEDSMQVSNVTGNPNGMHLYNVDELANDLTGGAGVGGNDQYYGVFNAFGSSPTYTATYYYRNNDAYQSGVFDESGMTLYHRNDNADSPWVDGSATLNTVSKTLTLTGQNTEYILGNSIAPLPVTLLVFDAQIKGDIVQLKWTTIEEINNDYFSIERSLDAVDFSSIGFVQGLGNHSGEKTYEFIDNDINQNTIYYYRLVQVDFDGKRTYSEIEAVSFNESANLEFVVFPNPLSGHQLFVKFSNNLTNLPVRIEMMNTSGEIVLVSQKVIEQGQPLTLPIDLNSGLYLMRLTYNGEVIVTKLIIK